MQPTKGKLPLPDPRAFIDDRNPRVFRKPLARAQRYSPMRDSSLQEICREAFTTIRAANLSTQRKGNFIPYEISQRFSDIVLEIKKLPRFQRQNKEVYTYLVSPLMDKIAADNARDLMEKLQKTNLTKDQQREYKSKIELFNDKNYLAFTALSGLMNAQGWKKDQNNQPLRPEADHRELNALNFLAKIRRIFSPS